MEHTECQNPSYLFIFPPVTQEVLYMSQCDFRFWFSRNVSFDNRHFKGSDAVPFRRSGCMKTESS